MEFGIVLPGYEIPTDTQAIAEFAPAAEALGYRRLAVIDHVIGADPRRRPNWQERDAFVNMPEPLMVFAYLAALTKQTAFTPDVIVLPQRQTARFAKQVADLDVLCDGRLRLGVGIGETEQEYQALGEDFHTRGKRIEEQIAVLRALYTQEVVPFHGRWHHIEEMGLRPLPIQRPVRIWIGGQADAVVRRVAALGDGWLPLIEPDDSAPAAIARLHEYAREAGRDPASIPIEGAVYTGGKTPDQWRREVAAWLELGASNICCTRSTAGSHLCRRTSRCWRRSKRLRASRSMRERPVGTMRRGGSKWRARRDLNSQPRDPKSRALSIELRARKGERNANYMTRYRYVPARLAVLLP
jgi:probable F420-dependent oxidoreductase